LRAALLAVPVGLFTAATALAGNGGVAPVPPHSPNTEQISNIYWLILGVTGVIFVLVGGALVYFIVRYRPGRRPRPAARATAHRRRCAGARQHSTRDRLDARAGADRRRDLRLCLRQPPRDHRRAEGQGREHDRRHRRGTPVLLALPLPGPGDLDRHAGRASG